MPLNKLFPKLDVDNFPKTAKEFNSLFSEDISTYSISIIWTKGLDCDLLYLGGKADPSTKWHLIISRPVSDNDGEITFELGKFTIGQKVSISMGLHASLDAIPKAAVLITNQSNGKVLKYPAGDDFQKIDAAQTVPITFDIVLP